jgi:hypothetical protein
VRSELVKEVAIEGLTETKGKGNLGNTAVDLLCKFREASIPDYTIRKHVSKNETLAVRSEGLGLQEAKDLLSLLVITEHGRGEAESDLGLLGRRHHRLERHGLLTKRGNQTQHQPPHATVALCPTHAHVRIRIPI